MFNIVCLKWGDKYPDYYVNKLYGMVKRNISHDFRFICFTDKNNSIREEVEVKSLSQNLVGWWNKLWFFSEEFQQSIGNNNTTLYIDLDVVIVDSIDCFFEIEGDFCIIREWIKPKKSVPSKYNSSVFRFIPGKQTYVWNNFIADPQQAYKRIPGDQDWLSEQIPNSQTVLWPEQWCRSFKWHCIQNNSHSAMIPEDTKILVFHGKPNPCEAVEGTYTKFPKSDWLLNYWKE